MSIYRMMYTDYLEKLKIIRKEIVKGICPDYYDRAALNDYYAMFGALTYMFFSREINDDEFSALCNEAWSAYEQSVARGNSEDGGITDVQTDEIHTTNHQPGPYPANA